MSNDVEIRIKNIMSQVFAIEPNIITMEASPDNIMSWNSLGHMNLVLALEEAFYIKLDAEQIIEMMNYELVVHIIKEQLELVALN